MPADRSKIVSCDICGKQMKQAGLPSHRKACSRRAQRLQEDIVFAENLLKGPDISMPPEHEVDDIRIETHPHSGIPLKTSRFSDFTRNHFPKPSPPDTDHDPWHPFRTLLDFEVSELVLEAGLTKDQTGRLIKMMQRIYDKREHFTLRNYDNIRQTWDAVGHRLTPFQKEVILVSYQNEPEPRTFPLWRRSLWDWACDLLKDPRVGPHFVFDAQRLFKFNGQSFVRFIDEPWTADDFWRFQSNIPADSKVLAFILYADKAKLSSFGREKGYPIIARIANLPVSIRNGEGFGGGRCVGWLPIVKEDKRHANKPAWANFKAAVWHESFKKVLTEVASHSKTGCWATCWDDVIPDYEEQSVMTLIRGVRSKFPCPVCLIPREEILNAAISGPYERRKRENVVKTLEEARSQERADEKEVVLRAQGLRDVDNAFNTVAHADSHRLTSFDRLHANHEGMFGDHLWVELQAILNEIGRAAVAEVDDNFSAMPRWRGLNHFDQVIDIYFNDGTKHEDISKLIVFACHGILTEEQHKTGYMLLHCICAYLEFDMYITLDVQTEDTIGAGREALSTLTVLMHNYIEKTKDSSVKNWNFPKNHIRLHVFDDIQAKGATRNFNTKPNEKAHGPFKDSYQNRTNFKNVAQQILNVNHHQLASQWLRCKIDDYNIFMSSQTDLDPDLNLNDASEEFFHIKLGSAQKSETFEDIEHSHADNKGFERFRLKVNEFLNKHFTAVGKQLPGGKQIQFSAKDQITEHRYVRVNYESLVDWCLCTDYLQCSPNFFGTPRYDCVIIKTQNGFIFGRLIFIFQCHIDGDDFPLALVQPYDAPAGVRTKKDKHLNFWRVRARPRTTSSEVFSVQSIVCGAALVQDFSRAGDFLVIDTVDTDMFLRMHAMHKAAGHY
ncbi:hypothetical protein PAXINDRAFT_164593 [Paxillus involutus ATCC 200175]|uniref:Uncharacterized protein n=1 Tax=Paxillus involutus ATCC 200175 TaxID=664439 RepID=A0A0C9SWY2_PAXIN|nr:hypothetical protein PAXINDRAFT_164593 [Paxillus involutus ATCC 200175]